MRAAASVAIAIDLVEPARSPSASGTRGAPTQAPSAAPAAMLHPWFSDTLLACEGETGAHAGRAPSYCRLPRNRVFAEGTFVSLHLFTQQLKRREAMKKLLILLSAAAAVTFYAPMPSIAQ